MSTDPRPLVGEPLPLDLLNTRWYADDTEHDLLDRPDGLATWLTSAGLDDCAASPAVLTALRATREALEDLTADDGTRGRDVSTARELLNDTLRHGRLVRLLGADGPVETVEVDAPEWRPAWLAADAYLRLLANDPGRLRVCAGPCRLRFYDVSKSGRRRWCSMAACGNRAKARTHYARTHGT